MSSFSLSNISDGLMPVVSISSSSSSSSATLSLFSSCPSFFGGDSSLSFFTSRSGNSGSASWFGFVSVSVGSASSVSSVNSGPAMSISTMEPFFLSVGGAAPSALSCCFAASCCEDDWFSFSSSCSSSDNFNCSSLSKSSCTVCFSSSGAFIFWSASRGWSSSRLISASASDCGVFVSASSSVMGPIMLVPPLDKGELEPGGLFFGKMGLGLLPSTLAWRDRYSWSSCCCLRWLMICCMCSCHGRVM
mmetsp:Transcript_19327/g.30655  ORF Transcript_19327/g.30655 Transcript_19327/m.30655 type:complete len:247 (-) Transcript_19327:427-1167(-)